MTGERAKQRGARGVERKINAGLQIAVVARQGPQQIATGDVESIQNHQHLNATIGRAARDEATVFGRIHFGGIQLHPVPDWPACLADSGAGRTARKIDRLLVPRILRISRNAKFEHACAGNNPLDEIDLRLIDLRHNHLQLIEAVASNRNLLLTTWIDATTDCCHEFVHIDFGSPPRDFEFQLQFLFGLFAAG